MVDASRVDADHFHALFYQPVGGAFAQARRVTEIVLAVGIASVPAGVDKNDIAAFDRRLGALQIGWLDELPFLFRNRQHDAGAEESLQRQIADRRRAGNEMDRRIDVRRGVKNRGDLVRHHTLLGVVCDALELDLLVTWEDRRIHPPAMAELVKLKPAHRIDNGRHFGPSPNAIGGSDRPIAAYVLQFGPGVSRSGRAFQVLRADAAKGASGIQWEESSCVAAWVSCCPPPFSASLSRLSSRSPARRPKRTIRTARQTRITWSTIGRSCRQAASGARRSVSTSTPMAPASGFTTDAAGQPASDQACRRFRNSTPQARS